MGGAEWWARDLVGGEEEGGEDRVSGLITYGDIMSLLFAFFVALLPLLFWSGDLREAATASIRSSFGVLGGSRAAPPAGAPTAVGAGPRPLPQALPDATPQANPSPSRDRLAAAIRERLQRAGQADLEVLPREEGVVIRVQSNLLFPSGSDQLLPGGRERVLAIAAALRDLPGIIRVEGHTDDVPIRTGRFPSNWELSAARAVRVVRILTEEGGVDPRRVYFAGYGEYRPLVANVSEANRQRNRRVEVYLLTPPPDAAGPEER